MWEFSLAVRVVEMFGGLGRKWECGLVEERLILDWLGCPFVKV